MRRTFFSCFILLSINLLLKGELNDQNNRIVPDYKLATAEKVMQKLIKAFPSNKRNPVLKMTSEKGWVAKCSHNGIITLEEKAYNICTGFGADSLDAMACLLGHELIHYYFDHNGNALNFVRFSDEQANSSDTIYTKTIEYESDLKGNLLAAMAGYNSLNIYDQVLDSIYKEYRKNSKIEGYPSLDDRIKDAKKQKKEAADLFLAFRMANNLMVVKEFDRALSYYEHIAMYYGTSEIYNNIALCYLLRSGYVNTIPYKFPFELDAESNLGKDKPKGGIDFNNDLRTAKVALSKALYFNEAYKPALINLACIAIIERDEVDANYFIAKLRKSIIGNPTIIEGLNGLLQAYVFNDTVKAIQFFDEAIAKKDLLAQFNKSVLLGENKSGEYKTVDISIEKVGGLDLTTLSSIPDGKLINGHYMTDSLLNESHIMAVYDTMFFLFNQTKKNTKESTQKGVRVGMVFDEVISRYGNNFDVVYSGQKRYIGYLQIIYIGKNKQKKKALIFILEDDIVQGWMDYYVEW